MLMAPRRRPYPCILGSSLHISEPQADGEIDGGKSHSTWSRFSSKKLQQVILCSGLEGIRLNCCGSS